MGAKQVRLALLLVLMCVAGVGLFPQAAVAGPGEAKPPKRAVPVDRVIAALRKECPGITVRDRQRTEDWTWVEIQYTDEEYPLTIDVVAKNPARISRTVYLITASSLNFKSSFFTPENESLAHTLASSGCLVVGVTPREDNVPLDADQSVMESWGMAKHKEDIREIVQIVQASARKPYDIVGHSLGAICALDYAATYSDELETVVALDVPSFNPEVQTNMMVYAGMALGAYDTLMTGGTYAEHSIADYKVLLAMSAMYPTADSGMPRDVLGLPGNFTLDGLLHFSLIFTSYVPGIITELTGLPQEWPMVLGNTAGYYEFALNPTNDNFGLTQVDVDELRLVATEIGSGSAPLALLRDYTSAIAGMETYTINWSGIEEKLIWVNAQLGMGAQTYGADLVREAGNTNVTVHVVPGYGHADVVFGTNAKEDVWDLFVPEPVPMPATGHTLGGRF